MSDKANEKVPSVVEENTEQNEVAQAQQSQELQEPKNVQELTNYIQSMLQQMQDRFQTMSDQVIFSVKSKILPLKYYVKSMLQNVEVLKCLFCNFKSCVDFVIILIFQPSKSAKIHEVQNSEPSNVLKWQILSL